MRIATTSVEDFLKNLKGCPGGVCLDTIYLDKIKREVSESSTEIVVQASAILQLSEHAQALLQCGESFGFDRDGEFEASEDRNRALQPLVDYCQENEISIRPGMLDM